MSYSNEGVVLGTACLAANEGEQKSKIQISTTKRCKTKSGRRIRGLQTNWETGAVAQALLESGQLGTGTCSTQKSSREKKQKDFQTGAACNTEQHHEKTKSLERESRPRSKEMNKSRLISWKPATVNHKEFLRSGNKKKTRAVPIKIQKRKFSIKI
jgi:hypothetical protein